jgi:hypothetical protein
LRGVVVVVVGRESDRSGSPELIARRIVQSLNALQIRVVVFVAVRVRAIFDVVIVMMNAMIAIMRIVMVLVLIVMIVTLMLVFVLVMA